MGVRCQTRGLQLLKMLTLRLVLCFPLLMCLKSAARYAYSAYNISKLRVQPRRLWEDLGTFWAAAAARCARAAS
jgi:hypothetical protein